MTEQEYKMIRVMKNMQDILDQAILTEHKVTFNLEKSKRALLDELGETNHEDKANWCWWKYTQKPVDNLKLLEELADAWHFALSIDNNENNGVILNCDIKKYEGLKLSTLFAYAVIKVDTIIPVMINITHKLGFSIEDVYNAYKEKNKVNFERLENGY